MYSPHQWYTNLVRPGLGIWQSAPPRGPSTERQSWACLLWGCPVLWCVGGSTISGGGRRTAWGKSWPTRDTGWVTANLSRATDNWKCHPPRHGWNRGWSHQVRWAGHGETTPCDTTYMWVPNDTAGLIHKAETDPQTQKTGAWWPQERWTRSPGSTDTHCIWNRQTARTHRHLLVSAPTAQGTQYLVITCDEKESEKEHIHRIKNLPANAGDVGLIPGSERSPGEGNSNLF